MSDEIEKEPEVEFDHDDRPRSSFSQLNMYANCSEEWRLSKLVKPRLPQKEAPWFTLGKGVHSAIEEWEISGRLADIVELFYAAYDKERAEALTREPDFNNWTNPGKRGLVAVLDDNRIKGAAMVQKFVEMCNDPDYHWEVMHDEETGEAWVEVPFDLDFGGVRVIGYIDAVSSGSSPTDWKTGKKENSRAMQLGLYKVALSLQYGLDGDTGQFFYLGGATDSRKTWGFSEHYDLRRYTKEYFTDIFTAAQRGIEAEVFIPNPSERCAMFCAVKEHCREMGSRPIPLDWASIPEDQRWWAPVDGDMNV